MDTDYEQLLKDNKDAKQDELEKLDETYGKTANDYQDEVDKQTQKLEDYEAAQKDLQQQQTDFAIDKIEKQREQTEKDYTKEQQAAYGDYKRQTDPYGVNAEQMAALGLSRSGYSESSKVAMYTAYQNRVAAARASFEQAKETFDNAIREAKLTNDINLAKIAQEVLEKKLALSMESVVYLGNLELEKAAKASAIEQTYYDREQEIREAQREAVFINGGGEGNADFSAVDAFFGDSVSEEEIAGMIAAGIITKETVNGVDVYKVADEEKARAIMNKDFGLPSKYTNAPANNQWRTEGQAEQPKYNYSDERVNAYFAQQDEVEALQKEYNKAKQDMALLIAKNTNNPRQQAGYNSRDPLGTQKAQQQEAADLALNAQKEYVNKLSRQLRAASNKLENMPKPVESSEYLSRDSECKKAKEAWETAIRELNVLKRSGVSAEALSPAEEKVRNAKKAFDVAYAKFRATERYTMP